MPQWIEQAGVIPVSDGKVCVITSSSGQRWVIPKGMIDPGHSASQAAQIEAWEEAGLVGVLSPEPVGEFYYEKVRKAYRVSVFRMDVTTVAESWPERHRRREWLVPQAAVLRLRETELKSIILGQFEFALAGV